MASVATIDGITSGLDYSTMIDAMADARRVPIKLLTSQVSDKQDLLSAYQSITTQVSSLRSMAENLTDGTLLTARSVSVSDTSRLIATAGAGTSLGTYDISVEQLATAHKISSGAVADANADLNFTGDIILNGKTISLKSTDDLTTLKDKINASGAGASASILTVSDTDHRLILRSTKTGVENSIDLVEANGSGFLAGLGLIGGTATAKHALTSGMASDYLASDTEAVGTSLGLSVAASGTVQINGTDVAINLNNDTLQDIATRITSLVSGVTATVTSDDGESRLELTGATTPTLDDAGTGVLKTLGLVHQEVADELTAAKDAIMKVDGFTVQRSSNSIDDAIVGMSFDLLEAEPGTNITLTVGQNTEAAVTALQNLVSSYNKVITTLNEGQEFDSETDEGGILFGQSAVLSLQNGLQSTLRSVSTLGGSMTTLSQIGLSADDDGQLLLNTTTLREALESDPEGVLQLLTTEGTTSDAEVEYVSSGTATGDSGSSGWAVNITQAATKATVTSEVLASGIQQNETLTISGKYNVTLTAGMTLEQAADKLNDVLDGNGLGMTASVVGNNLQIQSKFWGSNYAINIKSSLDDGAGGTGLGGATAGTAETVYGKNVEGTINGKKAVGWGQWLTGSEGDVKDLKLKVSGTTTGDRGVVKVSQGLASRLSNYAAQVTGTDGLLTRTATSISDRIEELTDDATEMEEDVQDYIVDLKLKFASLETLITKNSTILSYITGKYNTSSSSSE